MEQKLFIKEEKKIALLDVGDLVGLAIIVVVAGITVGYGLNILANIRTGFTANSLEANATLDAQTGLANLADNFPTIGLILAAAVIIGILVRSFAFGK